MPDGRGWTRNRWRPLWDKHAPAHGVTLYELRHTAASMSIHAGANVKTIQRMLGHASAAITLDTYGHLFEEDLDSLPARLDAHMKASRDRVTSIQGLGSVRPELAG